MTLETFEDTLQTRLGRPYGIDYRVRWSNRKQTYQIEQKIGRQMDVYGSEDSEDLIRTRDGYGLVMEVSPHPMFRCDTCHQRLGPITPLKWKEYICGHCKKSGEKSYFYLAFFPLCDRLLEHLERTHPKRTRQWTAAAEQVNAALKSSQDRKWENDIESFARYNRNMLAGNPVIGYTAADKR